MLSGSPPDCWNRLKLLADRACDGNLATEECGELADLLAAEESNRDWYVSYMRLNAWLDYDATLVFADPMPVDGAAPPEEPADTDLAQVLGIDSWVSLGVARLTHTAPYKTSSAIAASLVAATLFYGTLLLVAWNMRSSANLSAAGSQPVVAQIGSATDVVWSQPARPIAADAAITQGESLRIDSGTVELQLAQGATLFVEGPAEWSIEGDNRATLHHGKLTARVPAQAIGFALQTPTTRIVDLGTEFSVTVDRQGSTEVLVHQGKVEIGEDPASRVTLTSGESRRVTREQGISAGLGQANSGGEGQQISQEQGIAASGIAVEKSANQAEETLVDLAAVNGDPDSHWLMPQCWEAGQLPNRQNHGHIGGAEPVRLRTPQTQNPEPFAGGALSVHPGGMLVLKHFGDLQIGDLRLMGGQLYVWESRATEREVRLKGRLSVLDDSELALYGCVFNLASRLEGTGDLKVAGPGTLLLTNTNTEYRGAWQIDNALLVPMAAGSFGSGRVVLAATGHIEVQRNVESSQASLELVKGASIMLWKQLIVKAARVDEQQLAAGTYPVAELKQRFPGYFKGSGGSLTVAASAAAEK